MFDTDSRRVVLEYLATRHFMWRTPELAAESKCSAVSIALHQLPGCRPCTDTVTLIGDLRKEKEAMTHSTMTLSRLQRLSDSVEKPRKNPHRTQSLCPPSLVPDTWPGDGWSPGRLRARPVQCFVASLRRP
jgi:hypothetical protein